MLFSTYKNTHFVAVFLAGAIHVAAGFWAMMPSSPIVINQQAIQISFVAPNAAEKKSDDSSYKKNLVVLDKKDALKQEKNQKEMVKNDSKSLAAGKQTSGRVDPNALASRAAESEVVFDAAYLNNPAPVYPTYARHKGIQGKVLIEVVVKADGSAQKLEIARSSGHESLDLAALEAVKQWRFIPAKRGNKAVEANVVVPVEFKII
jgi:protein TonB